MLLQSIETSSIKSADRVRRRSKKTKRFGCETETFTRIFNCLWKFSTPLFVLYGMPTTDKRSAPTLRSHLCRIYLNNFLIASTCTGRCHGKSFCLYQLVRDRYSTFLLLGVSSPWLLLAVSLTRHFPLLTITQRFLYSTYPMKGITCIFTQTFHYPTFQLLDV